MKNRPVPLLKALACLVLCALLAACGQASALLAPDFAQPNTRPARNFTSFDGALRCMDGLLRRAGRAPVLISSTGIADHTRRINVAGDDMLINALIRMTNTSKAYVFLDQGLVSAQGLIDLLVVQKTNAPRPRFYIRGAISQLDSDVAINGVKIDVERTATPDSGIDNALISNKNQLSVVSVDLHLVRFPSRQVVPGASVANSMVVRRRSGGFGTSGLISLSSVDIELEVQRLESTGQAVRNLIEVSLIELIGKHARVPYWTCLAQTSTDSRANSRAEHAFVALAPERRIALAQDRLRQLNLYAGDVTGTLTADTRAALADFQARENILVTGIVDFDTHMRLQERLARGAAPLPPLPTSRRAAPTVPLPLPSSKTNPVKTSTEVSFDTLRDYLPPNVQRTERRNRSDDDFQSLGGFLPTD